MGKRQITVAAVAEPGCGGYHRLMASRLPALGPRGEGWVVAQFLLFGVIAWLGYADFRDHGPANPWGPIATVSGLAAIVAGGLVAGRGIWDLRASFSPFPRPLDGAALVDSGAYRLIRHPIYSGLVLAALGWAIVASSALTIASAGVLLLLFAGKSRREEVWLAAAHPGYADYQRRTRRMIPWVY